jgi:hypothetical protein
LGWEKILIQRCVSLTGTSRVVVEWTGCFVDGDRRCYLGHISRMSTRMCDGQHDVQCQCFISTKRGAVSKFVGVQVVIREAARLSLSIVLCISLQVVCLLPIASGIAKYCTRMFGLPNSLCSKTISCSPMDDEFILFVLLVSPSIWQVLRVQPMKL